MTSHADSEKPPREKGSGEDRWRWGQVLTHLKLHFLRFSFPGTAKNVLSGYGKYCTQDSLIVFIHVTMCPSSSLGLIYVVVHYVTEKPVYCGLTAGFLCFVLFFVFHFILQLSTNSC